MHRELLQWIEGLTEGDTLHAASRECDSTVTPPPTSEDWVTVKCVPPIITNIYQEVPDWTITESESEQASYSQHQPHGLVNEQSPHRDNGMLVTGHEAEDASVDHTRAAEDASVDHTRAEGDEEGGHSNEPNRASRAEQEEPSEGATVAEPRTTNNQMTQLSWNNLDNLKRRLTYDILPKVWG